MNRHIEAFLDPARQAGGAGSWIFLASLLKELHDFRGELASLLGPALEGYEAGQAAPRDGGLRLVERGAREAELGGSLGDRLPVFLDAAQHLVFDLHQVARVEELAFGKQVVGHGLRVRVEGARCSSCWCSSFSSY